MVRIDRINLVNLFNPDILLMMLRRSKSALVCVLIAIMLVTSTSHAQTTPDEKKKKETEQRLELEKKTLALLNEIASASYGLKLPENRVFILMNAADLLWASDEKRARNLYWDALNSIPPSSIAAPKNSETVSPAEREKIGKAYFLTVRLRQKLLRQVARRDSQLALEMMRASRQVPPRQLGLSESSVADDRRLEQSLAGEIAAHDPAQALQLARQGLAKGLTFELLNLLHQLIQTDSEKASQLGGDIISKLQTTNVATDQRASIIALQLVEHSRTPETNNDSSPGRAKSLILSDDQRRQLVEILVNAALTASANSNLLADIPELMPEIEQFFPERRAALERKLTAFDATLSQRQRDQNTYNMLIRRGMYEEILRSAASAADDDTRLMLYRQAAIIAVGRGATDSFRDLVSKEVSESEERRKILDLLDAEEISTAAGRKQLDRLRKLLPKIERKEERARAMAELALLLKEKGEDAEAASMLDEAATLIKTDLKDEKQTNALLTLLCAYAVIDPAKAFALAERTVDRANAQISLLMLLDRVIKSNAVKKNEIILDQAGILPLDFLVLQYGKGVAALAKADFNRTRGLADRFDRNELRLMAQLLIVKGLLQPQSSTEASLQVL
jgi:hypothetical protein